ncbi:nuclear transport factor 2 family protein [Streptomyces sp. NPDC001135]
MLELEGLLAEDTTWTFTMPGQAVPGPVAARAAVPGFLRDGHTAQTGRVRHHLGNVVVTTTDAVTAEVRAYLVRTRNTGESTHMISTGVYTFGLRRSDGGWRIAELTLTLDTAARAQPGSVSGGSWGACQRAGTDGADDERYGPVQGEWPAGRRVVERQQFRSH